jgi:ribosomal protein L32E
MPKFLRHTAHKYSKLGLRRKKKQVWRRPTGRDNKMREKRRGHPAVVSIGYSTNKKTRGSIMEKTPIIVRNVTDLGKIGKNQIALLGKIGKKNKIEIAKKAKELKIDIYRFNSEKFLKLNEKKVEIKNKDSEQNKSLKNKEQENKK